MSLCHIFLLLMCVWYIEAHCGKEGSSVHQQNCDGITNYKAFVQCIQERRTKRHLNNCEDSCDDCNCQLCQYEACSSSCVSCCESYSFQPCQTNYCCHKTCHSQCQTSDCRSSCRKNCRKQIDRNGISYSSGRNATTQIKTEINIHNIINNTNIIDVPINVTTFNFNNITVTNEHSHSSDGGGVPPMAPFPPYPPFPPHPPYPTPQPPYPPPQPPQPPYPTPQPPYPTPYPPGVITPPPEYPPRPPHPHPCCVVAIPQVCRPQISVPYVGCSYQTKRVCQSFCEAPVIHQRVYHGCQQESQCENSVYYSSQPGPICAFQPSYPYFGCGVPQGPYGDYASGGQYGGYDGGVFYGDTGLYQE